MIMRVGGIASGMDIEGMVQKLMEAERMPLIRLQQQQTSLEWKRDAFREINSKLLALSNGLLDMKLSASYQPRTASSNNKAVTVTADSSALNGQYSIQVKQLAAREMHVMKIPGAINLDDYSGEYTFYTYNKNNESIQHEFKIEKGDNIQQVLKKMEKASNGSISAFYDELSQQAVLETTHTGTYQSTDLNEDRAGMEIQYGLSGKDFFTEVLQFDDLSTISKAQNATFTYNSGLTIENSPENTYTINGLTFEFHEAGQTAQIIVETNVDQAFDTIKHFVDRYNDAIEVMNRSQGEEVFRDFLPLTKEQEEEMTEKQIEKWEEKAKSGLLRGERVIQDGMYALRQSLQSVVENEGKYKLLSQIGITTTRNYLDGGKLEINETDLKEALQDDPEAVYALFAGADPERPGLIHVFEKALIETKRDIEGRAGNSTYALDSYTLGKQMKELTKRVEIFQTKMEKVEQRYWQQFTQMEKAIARLNQQADFLYSNFNG